MIKIVQNTFLNLIAIFLGSVFAFAFSIIAARLLGPEQYGVYGLALWFFGCVLTFVNLGIPNAIAKFVSEYQGRGEQEVIRRLVGFVVRIEAVLLCAVCAVFLLLARKIALFLGRGELATVFFIAILAVIPTGLEAIFYSALRGLLRYRTFVSVSLVMAPLTFLLSIGALRMGYGVPGVLVVSFASHLANLGTYYFFCRKTIPGPWWGPLDVGVRERFLKYTSVLVGIVLLDMITIQRIETFFLGKFRSLEEVGHYTLAFGLTWGLFSLLTKTVTGVLVPTTSELHGARNEEKLRAVYSHSARLFALVVFPATALGILLAPRFIPWFYGEGYQKAVLPFQILMASACICTLSTSSSSMAFGTGRQLFVLKLGGVAAFLTLLLDLVLIPLFGTLGAACVDLTVKSVLSASYLIYFWRTCGMEWPGVEVTKVAIISLLSAVLSAFLSRGILLVISFGMTYGFLLLLVKAVRPEDIRSLSFLAERAPIRLKAFLLKTLASVEGYVR